MWGRGEGNGSVSISSNPQYTNKYTVCLKVHIYIRKMLLKMGNGLWRKVGEDGGASHIEVAPTLEEFHDPNKLAPILGLLEEGPRT